MFEFNEGVHAARLREIDAAIQDQEKRVQHWEYGPVRNICTGDDYSQGTWVDTYMARMDRLDAEKAKLELLKDRRLYFCSESVTQFVQRRRTA